MSSEIPQKDICKKCEIIPINKNISSLDNANMSISHRMSQYIKRQTPTTIYQGQPTTLSIYGARFTSAYVTFKYIGNPSYYQIIVTSDDEGKYYVVDHSTFIANNYYIITGLIPNTRYNVNVIAHYVSGDVFSINYTKNFSTSPAEGALKNVEYILPNHKTYRINSIPFYTSFDISFEPLYDHVDYVFTVTQESNQNVIFNTTISYENIANHTNISLANLEFDNSYNIVIKTIYGDNEYTYTRTDAIVTVDEYYYNYMSITNIYNTGVDVSYSEVYNTNMSYQIYANDVLQQNKGQYDGLFSISNLNINQKYVLNNAIKYNNTQNVYIFELQDVSFTTLNESPSTINNYYLYGKTIDISYSDASGNDELYSVFVNDISYASITTGYDGAFTITGLAPSNNYNIYVRTDYSYNHYISNELDVRTLNESEVNMTVSRIYGDRFDISYDEAIESIGKQTYYYFYYKRATDSSYVLYYSTDTYGETFSFDSQIEKDTSYNLLLRVGYSSDNVLFHYYDTIVETRSLNEGSEIVVANVGNSFIDLCFGVFDTPDSFDIYLNDVFYDTSTNANYRVTDLSINTNYSLYVSTLYVDYSYISDMVYVNTLNENPVSNVQVTDRTDSGLSFSFDASPNYTNNYSLVLTEVDTNNTIDNTSISNTSITYNGLTKDVEYELRIVSTYNSGNSYEFVDTYYSNIGWFVENIVASEVSFESVTITFNPYLDNSSNILNYNVMLSEDISKIVNTNSVTFDNLDKNTEYGITISANYNNYTSYTTSTILRITDDVSYKIDDINGHIDIDDHYQGYYFKNKMFNYILVGAGGSGGRDGSGPYYVSSGANGGNVVIGQLYGSSGLIDITIGDGNSGFMNQYNDKFDTQNANEGIPGGNTIILTNGYEIVAEGGTGAFSTQTPSNTIDHVYHQPINDWSHGRGGEIVMTVKDNTLYYNGNDGSLGKDVIISGKTYTFAGGGGSSSYNVGTTGGSGGNGGGGKGGDYQDNNNSKVSPDEGHGEPNTGGGAGGMGRRAYNDYTQGGSGVAYLWYPLFKTTEPITATFSPISTNSITMSWEIVDPDLSNNYTLFLNNEEQSTITNKNYIFTDLEPDTFYSIKISMTYITGQTTELDYNIKTLAFEFPPSLDKVILRSNSIEFSWNILGDVSEYILQFNDNSYNLSNTTLDFSATDLSHNTSYYTILTSKYGNGNTYDYIESFTTLNESSSNVFSKTLFHPFNGNSVIFNIYSENASAVSHYDLSLNGVFYSTIQTSIIIENIIPYNDYYGSLTTHYNAPINYGKYEFESQSYITDFSFHSIMLDPFYRVSQNAISLYWNDISSVSIDTSYTIFVNDDISYALTNSERTFDISGLYPNTDYTIKFVYESLSFDTIETIQTITTLNEGTADISFVLNSGLYGNLVVLDISNVSPENVSQNIVYIGDVSYNSSTSLFDIDVSANSSYSGNIVTIYNTPISETYNVEYIGGVYSIDFSFNVLGDYQSVSMIQNGNFSSRSATFDSNGLSRAIPDGFFGESIIMADNSNNTLKGHKYLDDDAIDKHVILFKNNQSTETANLSQTIDFLFKDYYLLAYYVANHALSGQSFGNKTASSTIKYQIRLLTQNNDVIYETAPIVNTDASWHKYEIKFFINSSYKDVKFSIQRNLFELNNLFLSDVSMSTFGLAFEPISFYQPNTYKDKWSTIVENQSQWKDIMRYDNVTNGNVFVLSTNSTLDFWLYVHDNTITSKQNVFSISSYPSVYIQNDNLFISHQDDNQNTTTYRFSIERKIPNHFAIQFDSRYIYFYKNGLLEHTVTNSVAFNEAYSEDNILVGSADSSIVVLRDVNLYDFALNDSQIAGLYESKQQNYTSIVNYSLQYNEASINLQGIETSNPIIYNLHNGNSLQKTLTFYKNTTDYNETTASVYNAGFSISLYVYDSDGTIASLNDTAGIEQYEIKTTDYNISNQTKIHHITVVFYDTETTTYLNGYYYNKTSIPINDISGVKIYANATLSDFTFYDKVLSQSEVFSSYLKMYYLESTYDLSGFFHINVVVPEDNALTELNYTFIGNTFVLNTSQPTISLLDPIPILDISMDPFDLNEFNKNSDSFVLRLYDYNIETIVEASNHPYIDIYPDINVTENTPLTIYLYNALDDISYSYVISGVDLTDLSGEISLANVIKTGDSGKVQIQLREDYKTENTESFIFSIPSLNLSTKVDISDTTINMLSVNKAAVNDSEEFTVILTIPTGKLANVLEFPFEITPDDSIVETTRVFSRPDNNIDVMEISFSVTPNASDNYESELLTISLTDYESSTNLILNDLDGPSLSISSNTGGEPGFVNEGDIITVVLTTPMSWPDGTVVPYDISGISASDISSSTDPTYSDLSGSFIISNAKSTIDFIVDDSLETEGDEKFTISLGYVEFSQSNIENASYSNITAQININDTSQMPIYVLTITNTNGDKITEINEGETFIVSLVVRHIVIGTQIPYEITGVDYSDFVGETSTDLNNSFTVTETEGTMSRTFVLRDDQTTDGDKTMTFTIPIDDTMGDDIVETLTIRDTSQHPIISVLSDKSGVTDDTTNDANEFNITIEIENFTNLTSLQKAQQYRYKVTGASTPDDFTGDLALGFIRLSNATINEYGKYTITKTYNCVTDESKTFTFTLSTGASVSVEFN